MWWAVVPALVFGVGIGLMLARDGEPTYPYVLGSAPMRVEELPHTSEGRAVLRTYNVHIDWQQLLGLVAKAEPKILRRTTTFQGLPAEVLVVPRFEGGRARLFGRPEREITVVRGRLFRSKSGQEFARADDGTWSGVRVVEYRAPRLFDAARDWVQDRFRV